MTGAPKAAAPAEPEFDTTSLAEDAEEISAPLDLDLEDGEAALDYIVGKGSFSDRNHFPAPDVVLLDLRLPRVDGLEVLRLVKSQPQFEKLPVVVLTSSDAENDVARSSELHASGFLTKPLETDTLQKILCGLGFGGGLVAPEVLARSQLNCPS